MPFPVFDQVEPLNSLLIKNLVRFMERKNINRGFKKLRVWQDAVSLYILSFKIFADFPFELKKGAQMNVTAIIEMPTTVKLTLKPW